MNKKKVLQKILFGSIILSYTATLVATAGYIHNTYILNQYHAGIYPQWMFLISLIFTLIFYTSQRKPDLGGKLLTMLFLIIGISNSILWGADVPVSYLIYILTIIIGGVIISPQYAFILSFLSGTGVMIVAYLQANHFISYDGYWLSNPPTIIDGAIATIFFSIIAIVSWLSNREIESSLHRAESSEKALKKERDMLEVRVQERTRDLQKAQLEKLLQLQHFAGLGKLASGLIHELLNPLTVISLNLDDVRSQTHRLKQKAPSEMAQELDETIRRARDATLHIEKYVVAARKQIQQQSVSTSFSPKEELDQLLKLFSYRSKKDHIPLKVICPNDIHLKGDPIKFNQLMSILITNAFDAYSNSQKKNKTIALSIQQVGASIIISITDHGRGIPTDMQKKIFEPFFTTKDHSQGIGIGLSIAQEIVHVHFKGTITVSSSPDKATTFTITITSSKEVS